MSWDLKSDRPIYTQLIEQLELRICAGVYPPGGRMPSVRDLAQEASVNPNTMQRALAKLEEDGLLYSHRTSGRFVTEDTSRIRETKSKLAQEQIEEFLQKITDLGFEISEILSIIKKITEELKK
ncbi:MAG TPA: GntR family transcriptional regulator [Clostridiales bacterium]|nr:GntR family transcriptional regulator [Clostridia bacterium]MDD4680662.1 GntR family transcriptional regulator [Clostridia bacterium]HCS73564.1 GntR family transcriptional regulator [Clostridiales bacterium]